MARKLTRKKAEGMLQEILLAAPETQFEDGEGCIYFNPLTGAPRCVVGHVFTKIGIEVEDLDHPSDNRAKVDVPGTCWERKIAEPAIVLLARAQQLQDLGMSWGVVHENLFGDGG